MDTLAWSLYKIYRLRYYITRHKIKNYRLLFFVLFLIVLTFQTLYVFVDIKIDTQHFVDTIVHNFKDKPLASMALVGTIQFSSSLHVAKRLLLPTFPNLFIPQSKPLSPGITTPL